MANVNKCCHWRELDGSTEVQAKDTKNTQPKMKALMEQS
jgi:hypothetical protein